MCTFRPPSDNHAYFSSRGLVAEINNSHALFMHDSVSSTYPTTHLYHCLSATGMKEFALSMEKIRGVLDVAHKDTSIG